MFLRKRRISLIRFYSSFMAVHGGTGNATWSGGSLSVGDLDMAGNGTFTLSAGSGRVLKVLPAKNRIIVDFLKQMKVATARPVIPQGGQIYSDFGPNVQKVLNGSVTARVGMLGTAKSWKLKLFPDDTDEVK